MLRGLPLVGGLLVADVLSVLALASPGHARAAACTTDGAPAVARRDSTVSALYAQGQSFPEFLEATVRRRDEWHRSAERVQIAEGLIARARAVGGNWRLLVVAVDSCGDSMRQVPYAARLAELVPGLSLRIVTPAVGGGVQESHRSLDGRRATPTYVLLDAEGAEQGCVVELPRPLRHWLHERRDRGSRESSRALADSAMAWYAADAGTSIVEELVTLLEQAKAGTPQCERGGA